MVSNKKKCPNCSQVMPCATKNCKACGTEQPKKARLTKRLQALDMKKEEWIGKLKKNHNEAAMLDEAVILLEKLHAMGYKPLLLLQKEGNGKKMAKITSLTPRCDLDPLATQHLTKMTAFYELVCAGWKASEDTITLTLTPCDEQATSEEAGLEGPAVEAEGPAVEAEGPAVEAEGPAVEAEGPAVEAEGPAVEAEGPAVEAEGPAVEAEGPAVEAEGPAVEADGPAVEAEGPAVEAEGPAVEAEGPAVEAEGPAVEAEGPAVEAEGPAVEAEGPAVEAEGPAVEAVGLMEEAGALNLPKKGTTGKRKRKAEVQMDKGKIKQKNCSYHTGLGVYPIRSALKERVRKGQSELLIDWEPCAACGKQWTPTWEPKESFV